MNFDSEQLNRLKTMLDESADMYRDLLMTVRMQEIEIAELKAEIEEIRKTEKQIALDVLRFISDKLDTMTELRIARDKEERKGRYNEKIQERLEETRKELEEILKPRYSLFPKWVDDPGFQCYALVSD